jgi:hypothetical protein
MFSCVLLGFRFPESASTAARALSTVKPLFKNPCLEFVSSAISPSSTCSVVTCTARQTSTFNLRIYQKMKHVSSKIPTSSAPKFFASC